MLLGMHAGASPEEWRERLTARELLLAGYLSGEPGERFQISEMRLTAAGRAALDPSPRDPLDEARLRMRTSLSDAVIQAVEVALGNRLRDLGHAHNIAPSGGDTFKQLSTINDGLTGKNGPRIYGKPWKKVIDALLDVRNEYAHGRGDALPHDVAEWVLDTVSILLAALPPAD